MERCRPDSRNPWIAAVTFTVHLVNIAAMLALEEGLGLNHE
ncbi:MAG: hypothetical protein WDN46_14920 [Methylocella sp.]